MGRPDPHPFPSFGGAIVIHIIVMASFLAVGALFSALGLVQHGNPTPLTSFVGGLVSCAMPLGMIRGWSRRSWKDLLALRPVAHGAWWPILVSGAALQVLARFSAAWVLHLLPPPGWCVAAFTDPTPLSLPAIVSGCRQLLICPWGDRPLALLALRPPTAPLHARA